jgi:hypothetical protein
MKTKAYINWAKYVVDSFSNFFNFFMRYASIIMVVFCMGAIMYVIVACVINLLPNILQSWLQVALHSVIAMTLITNVYCNYFTCILTPPGSPTKYSEHELKFWDKVITVNNKQYTRKQFCYTIADGVYFRFCKKCNAVKPPRAHHCSVINRCVYEMDHFCPWMFNTIGRNNYKYFVLFLYHMFTGAFYVAYIVYHNLEKMNEYDRYVYRSSAGYTNDSWLFVLCVCVL